MARKVVNYAKWTQDQWQQYRQSQRGIGGSDIASVLGVNKWKSKRRLWAELTGAVQREDISNKPAVRMGHKLEPIVAELFAEATGYTVRRNNWILQHDTIDYLFANIDREVTLPDGRKAVLECKTTNANLKKLWQSDSVPLEYMAQVQFYLMITGYDLAFMAVLIGGQDFDFWQIERDEKIIAQLEEAAADFWHCVENGIQPAIDGSEDAAKLLLQSYEEGEGVAEIDPTDPDYLSDQEKIEIRQILKAQIDDLTTQVNAIDNHFKEKIGKAGVKGLRIGEMKVNWNFTERKKVNEKAIEAAYPDLWTKWQQARSEFTTVEKSRSIRY